MKYKRTCYLGVKVDQLGRQFNTLFQSAVIVLNYNSKNLLLI